jgi:hypothetical protein
MVDHTLQLKITLKYSKPPIWRRLQIPANYTFLDLHSAIQDSFGWEDYHLHQFIFGDRFEEPVYIGPRHKDDFVEYIPEKETPLHEWLKRTGRTCTYEYDFGDSWDHIILLEKILLTEPSKTYPRCMTGKRACPPEDSGGIPGYDEKLEILKHPRSRYYKEICEWMGDFEPEYFDPAKVVFKKPEEHDLEKWN